MGFHKSIKFLRENSTKEGNKLERKPETPGERERECKGKSPKWRGMYEIVVNETETDKKETLFSLSDSDF